MEIVDDSELVICVFVDGHWRRARPWQSLIFTKWLDLPRMAQGLISEEPNTLDTIRIKYHCGEIQLGTYRDTVYVRGKKGNIWQGWYPIAELPKNILFPKRITQSETTRQYFSLCYRV